MNMVCRIAFAIGTILGAGELSADIIRTNAFGLGADAQVDEQGGGNIPRGDHFELAARYTPPSTHNQHMMVRLDLSGITIADLDSHQDATFRLCVNRTNWKTNAATFEYYGLKPEASNQFWNESTVIFQNAPGLTYDGDMATRGFNSDTLYLGESAFSGTKAAGDPIDFTSTQLASLIRNSINFASANSTSPSVTLFVALKAGSPTGTNYVVKSNDADLSQGTGLLYGSKYNPQLLYNTTSMSDVNLLWQGGSGLWNNAAKWGPAVVPQNTVTTTYGVTISNSADTVSLNTDATIEQLKVAEGKIAISNGTHVLTVNRPFSFNNAVVFENGAGSTFRAIQGGEISGDTMHFIDGTLENHGQIVSRANVYIGLSLATVHNLNGATIDFRSDCWMDGSRDLINDGTLLKTGGTGVMHISPPLLNNGVVRVSSGTLGITKFSPSSGGVLETQKGGKLWIGYNSIYSMEVPINTRIVGEGDLQFDRPSCLFRGEIDVSGTTTFTGGTSFLADCRIIKLGKTVVAEQGRGDLGLSTGHTIYIQNLINNYRVSGNDTLHITENLSGNGLLSINTIVDGNLNPGDGVGITVLNKNLSIANSGKLIYQLSNNGIDQIYIDSQGSLSLGGELVLVPTGTFTPRSTDVFTLTDSTGSLPIITGTFNNVLPGGRYFISGLGSFRVDYGSTSPYGNSRLMLSNFQSVPEPTGLAIFSVVGAALLRRKRIA